MSVLSIGTFDGIHLGHRKLLQNVLDLGRQYKQPTVIVSFRDHPAYYFDKDTNLGLLCPSELKREELLKLGIDHVDLLDFTPQLAAMSADEFLHKYLLQRWQARYIVMGYDSHFGKDRQGNYDYLSKQAPKNGFQLQYVEPLLDDGLPVSSSRIRHSLQQGDIWEANRLLGRPYRLLGTVISGRSKGRDFGFPTANLQLSSPHQLIPKEGIYLSRVHLDSVSFFGLTNIGRSPTVKQSIFTEIETFLIDYTGDLYGSSMQVELLHYLREEIMFANTTDLIQAMHQDLAKARSIIRDFQP